jgi:hypothetical protein
MYIRNKKKRQRLKDKDMKEIITLQISMGLYACLNTISSFHNKASYFC